MTVDAQLNARHDLRLCHIPESKTVGDLLFQNIFELRSSGFGNAEGALDDHLIAAASDGVAYLNAFFLIERLDPTDKFIHNPLLQIGVRQITQSLARRGDIIVWPPAGANQRRMRPARAPAYPASAPLPDQLPAGHCPSIPCAWRQRPSPLH